MTVEIATAIIAVIQELMQLFGTSSATVQVIDTIINLLQKILPLIVDIVPTVYASIKNIIVELKADPTTTQAQWDVLDAIDTQLDAANDAAMAAVDPDATAAT
jgi:phage-related protein